MKDITPEEWAELEAAANNGGYAYTTFDPGDRSTPIIRRLVDLGLMRRGEAPSVRVLTDDGRKYLATSNLGEAH